MQGRALGRECDHRIGGLRAPKKPREEVAILLERDGSFAKHDDVAWIAVHGPA